MSLELVDRSGLFIDRNSRPAYEPSSSIEKVAWECGVPAKLKSTASVGRSRDVSSVTPQSKAQLRTT